LADRTAGERPGAALHGALIIDKPRGPTSHDVVARVRRALREKRVGHAGTLDPMATGVLLVLVGEGTKLAPYMTAADKRYTASVTFGAATATLDAEGQVLARADVPDDIRAELAAIARDPAAAPRGLIAAAIDEELARTEQIPPAYSAIQIDGERSHDLARAGKEVDLPPRAVAVRSCRVLGARCALLSHDGAATGPKPGARSPFGARTENEGVRQASDDVSIAGMTSSQDPGGGATEELPSLDLDVVVSKGYYVRSLARDLGARLGLPAHLSQLRRTQSGAFTIDAALPLDAAPDALRAAILPLAEAVRRALPAAVLTDAGAVRARQGKRLTAEDFGAPPPSEGAAAWLDPSGKLVAIGHEEAGAFVVLRGFGAG
jgi:tRNA pseudouridine55 synthase